MLLVLQAMNNVTKTGLLVYIVIAIGLFGISTTSIVDKVIREKDQQVKNSNTVGIVIADSSSNNNNVKCNTLDQRGCR